VIVRSGVVKLVLCGHYHRGVPLFSVDGTSAQQAEEGGAGRPTFFAAAPSFAEPPHRYWVYTLAEGAVTCREMQVRGRAQQRQPVVFLDRDGTISTLPAYRFGPERMELLPGAAGALRALKDAGFALVVVSNQAAVARGWVTREMVGAVNDRMAQLLWEGAGVELDGVYCAYHYPDAIFPELRAANHPDAKPNTGLLTRAAGELGLDLSRAYFIGDRLYDLGAGRNIGAKCVLVKTGHGADVAARLEPGQTDAIVDDLPAAAQWILGEYP